MAISINQITSGMGLLINGEVFLVTEHQHVKPGKGGAFLKAKLKNVKTGQLFEKTIKPADKVEEISLDEKKLQNLYQSGDMYHFMDNESYEEVAVHKDVIGEDVQFLQDNLEVTGVCYKGEILKVVLPTFIEAKIANTEPGLKGDSSKAGTKPATIDTGATVQVPLFIETGELVKIDTRTGAYVERVKR